MNWSQEMKVHTDICVHINLEKFESAKQFPFKNVWIVILNIR